MMLSDCWGQVPGIVVVAPRFQFFDAADAAKVLEEQVDMFAYGYMAHSEMGKQSALYFARQCIPMGGYWL